MFRAVFAGAPLWCRSRRARAQDEDAARQVDSFGNKHLFGFTEGSDIAEPGSREAEFTSTGAFGKGGGVSCQAVEQEAAYDAAATDRFGDELIDYALYVGPTMHLQMEPKAFLSLAWSTQVAASLRSLMAEVIEAWNQSDLSRQKAQMVFGVEF